MAHIQTKTVLFTFFAAIAIALTSCRPYHITQVDGGVITVDSTLDLKPDSAAIALLAPYKAAIDSMMYRKIGVSEMTMGRGTPESLLSNLVADVLRESAKMVIDKPANIGLVNMGGLRNDLPKGDITCGNIYEILPFDNSLCVLTLDGTTLNELLTAVASKGGDGISGAKLVINQSGKLLSATVDGEPIDTQKLYTVATIDYLADGNDGMLPLTRAIKRSCPPGATLRSLFMNYVEKATAEGKQITSKIEGRIKVNN